MWRKIDLTNCRISMLNYNRLCSDAVNSSLGGLVEIKVTLDYLTKSLLNYIVDRSSNLRSLGLVMYTPKESKGLPKALAKLSLLEELEISLPWWFILNLKAIFQACPQLKTLKLTLQDIYFPITDEGVTEAFAKLPLLEELWITDCLFPGKFLRAIGQSCPKLKTLRLNCNPEIVYLGNNLDSNAIAIAESMPKLRHLQFLGNGITNLGLKAIFDGCPHLEHLDLRKCYNINLVGDLKKQCLERIRDLRRPNDSTADCPFDVNHHGTDSDEDYTNEGYYTGFTIKFLRSGARSNDWD